MTGIFKSANPKNTTQNKNYMSRKQKNSSGLIYIYIYIWGAGGDCLVTKININETKKVIIINKFVVAMLVQAPESSKNILLNLFHIGTM